jgi:hypothetical protein
MTHSTNAVSIIQNGEGYASLISIWETLCGGDGSEGCTSGEDEG